MSGFSVISAKAFFTFAIFIFILSPKDYLLVPILNGLGFIISGIIGLIYSLKFVSFQKPNAKKAVGIAKESFSLLVSNLFKDNISSFDANCKADIAKTSCLSLTA